MTLQTLNNSIFISVIAFSIIKDYSSISPYVQTEFLLTGRTSNPATITTPESIILIAMSKSV